MTKTRARPTLSGALLIAGLGLGLSGCAYSMSEFAVGRDAQTQATGAPVVVTGAPVTASVAPVAPTALVEEEPVPTPRPAPAAAVVNAAPEAYPNINAAPERPKADLLSAEEKARVIAELEALARAQGATTEKARIVAKAECEKAVAALPEEERRKREEQGLRC